MCLRSPTPTRVDDLTLTFASPRLRVLTLWVRIGVDGLPPFSLLAAFRLLSGRRPTPADHGHSATEGGRCAKRLLKQRNTPLAGRGGSRARPEKYLPWLLADNSCSRCSSL